MEVRTSSNLPKYPPDVRVKTKLVRQNKKDYATAEQEYIMDQGSYEKNKQYFKLWVTHSIDDKKWFNPPQREKYELFCLGYLFFYDNHISNLVGNVVVPNQIAHTLYFDWNEKNGSVSIFLSPGHDEYSGKTMNFIKHLSAAATESDPPTIPPPPPPIG